MHFTSSYFKFTPVIRKTMHSFLKDIFIKDKGLQNLQLLLQTFLI